MAYREGTVSVWVKSVPDGEMIGLPGLRGCPNHTTVEVDETHISAYEAMGYEWPESNTIEIVIGEEDDPGTPAVVVDEPDPPVVLDQTEAPVDPEPEPDLIPDGGN